MMSWTKLWSTLTTQFTSVKGGGWVLLLVNVLVALIMSGIVFLAYRLTYTGAAFSKKFMISLGMMTLVTTVIMNVISNNVALSLGMVGALSIIRFRTAVKDVRDATYIFWCIGIGICCGVSMYAEALIGCVVIFLFLLIAGQVRDEGRFLLIIRCTLYAQGRAQNVVKTFFENAALLKVQNGSADRGDLIYEMSARAVKRALFKNGTSIIYLLLDTDGVESADLVQQTDDITR